MNTNAGLESFRNEHGHTLTRFTRIVLAIIGIALPVFFLPSLAISVPVAKTMLFAIGTIVALAATFLAIIQRGTVSIPWNLFSLSIILLPVTFLLSAVFASDRAAALWGYGFETQTFGFLLVGVILTLLASFAFENKKAVYTALSGVVAAGALIGLFHVLRFVFGAGFLSFGIFNGSASSVVGAWSDLSYFAAFIAVLSSIVLAMMRLPVLPRVVAYAAYVSSLVLLVVTNISTAWWIAAVVSVVFMVYVLSLPDFKKVSLSGVEENGNEASPKRVIAWHSLAVIILAVAFLLSGSSITGGLSARLGTEIMEARPSWSATLDMARVTLSQNMVFGIGPNNFTHAWLANKPVGVNESMFWGTDFNAGIGLIPTFFATNGLSGIGAWLFFFGLMALFGVRSLFAGGTDTMSRFLSVAAFFGMATLWAIAFVAVPGHALYGLAFFMTGLFMAGLYRDDLISRRRLAIFAAPRASFLSVLVLIVSLIGVVSVGFLFAERSLATVYSNRAIIAANRDGNLALANDLNNRAIAIDDRDSFRRLASQINIAQISALLSDESARPETVRAQFETLLSSAIQNANVATEAAPGRYENWMNLGQVYGAVVPEPFRIEGAYESAQAAFAEARRLNSTGPAVLLAIARLEADHGNLSAAVQAAEEATSLKQNYAEAHFFIAQVAIAQGDINRAIERTQTAALLSPGNAGLFFQLGVLYYNVPNYQNAAAAMLRAVEILPDYANARYFLGLSLWRIGDTEGAIAQFEEIQRTNQDNMEIGAILDNLRTGRDPLFGLDTAAELPIN